MTVFQTIALSLCLLAPSAVLDVRPPGNSMPAVVASTQAQARTADSAAVMAVVRGFKAALAAGDSTKVISFLHPDLVVFESRQAENLAAYRSGHLAADIAYLRTVTQTTTKETFSLSGDLAVYTSLFSSAGTSRGRAVNSNGTETMVIARTPSGWRILHVHW